jgi:hypothetical protein
MRERAAMLGGTLVTSETSHGGFVVAAFLPRSGAAAIGDNVTGDDSIGGNVTGENVTGDDSADDNSTGLTGEETP